MTELNDAAAEANSPASPSQGTAASIGADPAPANTGTELIHEGNFGKFISHAFQQLIIERRAA
jgi:hypothetical protein